MEWVIIAVMVLMFVIIARRLSILEQKVRVNNELILANRTRQHSGTSRRATEASPRVDARARTTRRDTPDLPATGRMSKSTHRVVMTDQPEGVQDV